MLTFRLRALKARANNGRSQRTNELSVTVTNAGAVFAPHDNVVGCCHAAGTTESEIIASNLPMNGARGDSRIHEYLRPVCQGRLVTRPPAGVLNITRRVALGGYSGDHAKLLAIALERVQSRAVP
jgi:hypothetical protein